MKNNQKNLSIGLLIALIAFPQISETIYTPALPDVAGGLLTSAYMVEATLAIYFVGFAIGVLLWGAISDHFGRRKVMLVGLVIYGIGTYECANVGNIESLLAWRFLQALGASVGSVITQTILRDSYEGEERTKLFSLMTGALAFSPAIGPLIGGFISEYLGWRANFLSLALLSIILFIWTLISLPETRPKNVLRLSLNNILSVFTDMMSSRRLWGHILLIAGTNSILFGFYQEAPFFFIEQLGISPRLYGCFGLLIAAATIFSSRISYKKSSHFSPQSMIKCGAFYVLAGGVLLTLTVISGIFQLETIGVAVAITILFLIFFGIGLIIPNSLAHALKPYQMTAGTAGSIFGGCYYFLIAGCTWIMSFVHNGTALPLPIYITALGVIIVFASMMTRSPVISEAKITSVYE